MRKQEVKPKLVPNENEAIITYEVGQEVAIRKGYHNTYGTFYRVSEYQVTVITEDGHLRKFMKLTGSEVGHKGTKYDCPFLVPVETARKQDEDYRQAIIWAKRNLGME